MRSLVFLILFIFFVVWVPAAVLVGAVQAVKEQAYKPRCKFCGMKVKEAPSSYTRPVAHFHCHKGGEVRWQ